MQTSLQNRKKVVANSSRSVFNRKNRVEEGGASCTGMKRDHDSTEAKAQKMMRGRVEPFIMPIVVQAVPTMVHATRQITKVSQMTSPQERQLKE